MHNIAQGAHSSTVTSKRGAQYILPVGSRLYVHVRVSIVVGCLIFSRDPDLSFFIKNLENEYSDRHACISCYTKIYFLH
jgi:pSer/pThr/pTyr-binding forkhead associated (FHA) protein